MNILPAIDEAKSELEAIFKDLHANPEIGFTETRTAKGTMSKGARGAKGVVWT